MFGGSSSPTRDGKTDPDRSQSSPGSLTSANGPIQESPKAGTSPDTPTAPVNDQKSPLSPNSHRKSLDEAGGEGTKKRRGSGIASALLASAKHSLHISHSSTSPSSSPLSPQQSALQKLGKTDPALSVPQGTHNNSAGESHPGPRSTFRIGVAEDKNKKCRRTMEDTHAYLYNFLSTPAPVLGEGGNSSAGKKQENLDKSPGNSSANAQVVESDNGYFAVFDGHAGTFAADWCGKKLHLILEDLIRKNPNSPIPELLDQTFTSVDLQLQKLPLKNSGCTAICAVLRWEDRIPNSQSATGSTSLAPVAAAVLKAQEASSSDTTPSLPSSFSDLPKNTTPSTALPKLQESATRQRVLYTANVGDARIVLCRSGKALRLSYDHKGSDENEGRRIANAGGLILNNRVNGVLAVTRALGDAYMKDLVTGHPYTTETVIQPDVDEFIILACDGLWDVCSDQEAVDLIRHNQDPQHAALTLVEHALARFSTDNLSCMVVRFDPASMRSISDHKADPIGVEGDPGTVTGSGKTAISEADGLVKEARKSLHIPESKVVSEEEVEQISREIIEDQSGKEPGPELSLDPAKVQNAKWRKEKKGDEK